MLVVQSTAILYGRLSVIGSDKDKTGRSAMCGVTSGLPCMETLNTHPVFRPYQRCFDTSPWATPARAL